MIDISVHMLLVLVIGMTAWAGLTWALTHRRCPWPLALGVSAAPTVLLFFVNVS